MLCWYFSQIFQISYFKEHLLTAASETAVVTVFVLQSSRSEVGDNCFEKSEKTLRKKPVKVLHEKKIISSKILVKNESSWSFINVYLLLEVLVPCSAIKKIVCRSYPFLSFYKHEVYLNYGKSLEQ